MGGGGACKEMFFNPSRDCNRLFFIQFIIVILSSHLPLLYNDFNTIQNIWQPHSPSISSDALPDLRTLKLSVNLESDAIQQ